MESPAPLEETCATLRRFIAEAPVVALPRLEDATDAPDLFTGLDELTLFDQDFGHVHVDRDQPPAVIEVNDVAGVIETSHERYHAAIGRENRITGLAVEVDACVAAAQLAVEHALHAKLAGDGAGSGARRTKSAP